MVTIVGVQVQVDTTMGHIQVVSVRVLAVPTDHRAGAAMTKVGRGQVGTRQRAAGPAVLVVAVVMDHPPCRDLRRTGRTAAGMHLTPADQGTDRPQADHTDPLMTEEVGLMEEVISSKDMVEVDQEGLILQLLQIIEGN